MLTNEQNLHPHQWVDLHADYLYAYAITRIADEEQVRDLVQETFLSALERIDKFEGRSSERTWLTAILKHKIYDLYRKKSRSGIAVNFSASDDETEFFDPNLNNWKKEHWPEPFGVEENDPLHNKELNRILDLCMKKLPPLWLSVFTMKHMDDETKETICSELKVSDANFWVIIHRSKVNLRACLQKFWN
ncbi:sigma-70 family RNA polymerase sigma factor [Mucilaginibacter jinjuensis]|uniref:Sigma-70 family RNA polymerase sigma factor n=1 Tax=Mucilaginibacter jinjuensis TaxID=1176721 RepID=A0ABY7TCU7_9SPHI|nr:sigma-70 family RNA polymerase sigma factor [Mucilaginibacter jinjuensis]WCT14281.1 sigma-70 family RNA polymerase sigma factor [Mucilaginibacter jinjuensis]